MRPTRTCETPSKPSAGSARSTALPCGSRMPSFGRISTRAFTGLNLASGGVARARPDEPGEARARRRRGQVERLAIGPSSSISAYPASLELAPPCRAAARRGPSAGRPRDGSARRVRCSRSPTRPPAPAPGDRARPVDAPELARGIGAQVLEAHARVAVAEQPLAVAVGRLKGALPDQQRTQEVGDHRPELERAAACEHVLGDAPARPQPAAGAGGEEGVGVGIDVGPAPAAEQHRGGHRARVADEMDDGRARGRSRPPRRACGAGASP